MSSLPGLKLCRPPHPSLPKHPCLAPTMLPWCSLSSERPQVLFKIMCQSHDPYNAFLFLYLILTKSQRSHALLSFSVGKPCTAQAGRAFQHHSFHLSICLPPLPRALSSSSASAPTVLLVPLGDVKISIPLTPFSWRGQATTSP